MYRKVLVTYASKYGSTREVAEVVAAVLGEAGLMVDLQPVGKVRSLDGYHAIVLGTPLYFGAFHKDARSFLARRQETITQRPVAIFVLGPAHGGQQELQDSRIQLDAELVKVPWLKPAAVQMFGGKYDPARLRFPDNLIASLPASPLHLAAASDIRDWTAIRAWASSLAGQWQPVLSA